MTSFTHLNAATADLLDMSDAERIERVRSARWIGYPRAKEVLAKLEDLLIYPKSHRMPNLLIVGDTNNGKTMLVRRFCSLHESYDNPDGNGIQVPVLFLQAPPVPDEGRFYNAILELLFAPYKPSDRIDKKQFQVIRLMRYVNIRMLIIDEIHHILAGNLNKQKAFLNVIKYLGNELQIPIVGVGTKDAFRAIQTDSQLANRFEPTAMSRWKFETNFLRLLASFEKMLPMKYPSVLHETTLATILFSMSEGYIGELSKILTEAAVHSIQSGKEKIDKETLEELAWVAPSKRRLQPEGVVR